MKRVSLILSFLMFFTLLSVSQNIKHISLSFNVDDFNILKDKDGCYVISSDVYNLCFKSDTLLPALPYIGYNILVHNVEKYASHLCSSSKILIRNNANIAHNPKAIPTSTLPISNKGSNQIYNYQNKYPNVDIEFVGFNDYGDYRLLTFWVCPFEYDANTQKLYLKDHFDIDINLNYSYFPKSNASKVRVSGMNSSIKNMVVNPYDLEISDKAENTSGNNLIHQTGYEYVIVTSNQLKSAFQQLSNWKNRKGIRSKVLTVEEILSNYSGASKQEKIKRALADINGLSYVLLGGDTLNVPTCMCYIGYVLNTDSITPADIYYSCLGTMNWDSNGNGFYGELSDSVSLVPYLNISRAPVSTVEDAQVFVNRIIDYESAPDTVNWRNNILMSGSTMGYKDSLGWHPFYDNGISDSQIWSQIIYNYYIYPSNPNLPKWNCELTKFYDTYADFSGDDTYDFNASNLQGELSKGYTFVDVLTHGNKNIWIMEGSYPDYDYNFARHLDNNGYTIITTTACSTNALDYSSAYSKCLSQEFINNSQSGILSYWGTSRDNWYYEKELYWIYLGPEFDALTYRKLFEDDYHRMGKASIEVKRTKMSSVVEDYNLNRKIWMSLNLIGDPEMPVFLSKPKYFPNVDIKFVNDSIYIGTGVSGFDICFVNQTDSTDYYIARDIESANITFGRHNGVFDVCVTSPGYIPKPMICDKTYLQNTTMTGTKLYATNNVIIGSDVTNKVTQGPVIINSGSTIIKASQDVTITKDFEVKIGAEFKVTNE